MLKTGFRAILIGGVFALSGCSYVSDSLWPTLAGEDDKKPRAARVTKAAAAAQPAPTPSVQPALGSGNFAAPVARSFAPTGTVVGQKVQQLSTDLQQPQTRLNQRNSALQTIRNATVQNAQRYHGTVAAMEAKLQVGSTPGNPVLISQWNTAQGELDAVSRDIAGMNQLANDVASDSSVAAFLLESARATYGISGAVDQDHANLAAMEDDINQTQVVVDRLLNELSEDVSRQTAYVGNERRNLSSLALAIKNGELYGSSLASRAYLRPAAIQGARSAVPTAAATGRPLVVIRFDRPNVEYEQALYTAVSRALDQRPNAQFDVVAVSPSQGSPADIALLRSQSRKRADEVLKTLTGMGLPVDRVSLASTTNPGAQTSEVHLYVR